MEQDKHIKQILLNSAEGASGNFTDAVLKRIHHLSAVRRYDQPLVPLRWQRLFIFASGFIVISIFVLCLLVAAAQLDIVNWVKNRELTEMGYKLLVFIVCFWIVFAVNALLEKKFLPKGSMMQMVDDGS